MNKFAKAVIWMLLNSLLFVTAYLAAYKNNAWGHNIFVFFMWLNFISSVICTCSKDTLEKLRLQGPSVPLWIISIVDYSIIIMLVGAGWFFSGVILILTWGTQYNIYSSDND